MHFCDLEALIENSFSYLTQKLFPAQVNTSTCQEPVCVNLKDKKQAKRKINVMYGYSVQTVQYQSDKKQYNAQFIQHTGL